MASTMAFGGIALALVSMTGALAQDGEKYAAQRTAIAGTWRGNSILAILKFNLDGTVDVGGHAKMWRYHFVDTTHIVTVTPVGISKTLEVDLNAPSPYIKEGDAIWHRSTHPADEPLVHPVELKNITPIGKGGARTGEGYMGPIEVVLDLRGFVPISGMGLASDGISLKTRWSLDQMEWFRIPTKPALLAFYYGAIRGPDLPLYEPNPNDEAKYFASTKFLDESSARGDNTRGIKLAYSLSKTSGPFFQKVIGKFDAVEPILVFLNSKSAFIVLNAKYSDWSRMNGTGQLLIAMEFSRVYKEYKTAYPLRSTMTFSAGARQYFSDIGSMLGKIASSAAAGQ